MRTIRASEIGSYLYCRRAWWFQLQGAPSENQKELVGGSDYHQRHGRKVMQASLLRLAGWLFCLVAITLFAIAITLQLISH